MTTSSTTLDAQVPQVFWEPGPLQAPPGYVDGRRQPTLIVRVRRVLHQQARLQALGHLARIDALRDFGISAWGPGDNDGPVPDPMADWLGFVGWLAQATTRLLALTDLTVVDTPKVLPAQAGADGAWTVVLLPVSPYLPEATNRAWLTTLKSTSMALDPSMPGLALQTWRAGLDGLKAFSPGSANQPRLLRAALQAAVPVTPIGPGVYQYGHGRLAQWLDSTFTLQTSNISAKLARDKVATHLRLRQAGLPVPAQRLVGSPQEAVAAAVQIGYPVVVKPADLDGGQGVSSGLQSESELLSAYAFAREGSPNVLVEKHVDGRDYRLTVLDGHLLWAVERLPASVIGDGVRTVKALVEDENNDPLRGQGAHAPLKRLQLDEPALALLSSQGLKTQDIPAVGQRVLLRRIANVAAGGRPVSVMEQVHPDNAHLAVRAAQALRLDLAGVDLLIPDISRSWRECGAAICEVNAQPQLGLITGAHLYAQILLHRLGGNGRIPVIAVVGAQADHPLISALVSHMQALGYTVGWSHHHGVGIDEVWLEKGPISTYVAGQMLLTHPDAEALVLSFHDDDALRMGLAVDRIDWLIVVGTHCEQAHSRRLTDTIAVDPMNFQNLLLALMPACSEKVFLIDSLSPQVSELVKNVAVTVTCQPSSPLGLISAVSERWRHSSPKTKAM